MRLTVCANIALALALLPARMAFAVPAYIFKDIDVSGVNARSTALGINNAGQIVGDYYTSAAAEYGYVYDSVSRATTTLNIPASLSSSPFSNALGINDIGQVVGTYGASSFLFNLSADTYAPIAIQAGTTFSILVSGIDNAEQIVGVYAFPQYLTRGAYVIGHEGFLMNPVSSSVTNLALEGYMATNTYAINNLGQVLGALFNPNTATSDTYVYDPTAGTYTVVPAGTLGLNDIGQVVGSTTSGTTTEGFLFDIASSTSTALNDPNGVNGTVLTDINNAGEITGYYLDAQNVSHAFFALPPIATVPEPVSLALLATNLVGLAVFWRHRRQAATMRP